LTSTVSDQCD